MLQLRFLLGYAYLEYGFGSLLAESEFSQKVILQSYGVIGISFLFWKCDIIFESFRHRNKDIMEKSEYFITSRDVIGDDTYRKKIIEISRI